MGRLSGKIRASIARPVKLSMSKKSAKKKKKTGGKKNPWILWLILAIGGALSAAFLLEAVWRVRGDSFFWTTGDTLDWGGGESRMDRYAAAPQEVRGDLLYLSYLDSLARDDRALPGEGITAADENIARLVAEQAGVSRAAAAEWGLFPEPEEGHGELNAIFREMYRRGRVELPVDDASLWTHIRDRKVHTGYILFGQTDWASGGQIDFCGVVTAVNWLQPEYTAVLYRAPHTGRLVHGKVKEMPTIAYFGSGRPGDNIGAVYQQYFRQGLENLRGRKPLFKDMR